MIELYIFLICIVSSYVQAAASFGYGMLAMLVMSLFLPMKEATIIILIASSPIYIILFYYILWQKHIKIRLEYFLYPLLGNLVGRYIGSNLFQRLYDNILLNIFCIFMIVINIYFWFFMGKIKIKATKINGVTVGLFGGIFGTMYNISGPPIVAYYQAAEKNKYARMAYQHVIFMVGSVITFILHYYNGNINTNLLKVSLVGIVGTIIGSIAGFKTYEKLNVTQLQLFIRVLILVFSIALTVNNILKSII